MSLIMNGKDHGKVLEETLDKYTAVSKPVLKKGEFSAALSSVAALAVCTSESEAAVIVVDVGEAIVPGTPNNVLIDFDETGPGVDFEFAADDDAAYPFVRVGARGGIQLIGYTTGGFPYASRLASNSQIDGGGSFLPADPAANRILAFSYPASTSSGGQWLGGETGFIGFRIPDGGGSFNYGWVEVSVGSDNSSGTVIRYGIEQDVDVPVSAGVPETNSLACLALGAAGLLGWRQRRKSA